MTVLVRVSIVVIRHHDLGDERFCFLTVPQYRVLQKSGQDLKAGADAETMELKAIFAKVFYERKRN